MTDRNVVEVVEVVEVVFGEVGEEIFGAVEEVVGAAEIFGVEISGAEEVVLVTEDQIERDKSNFNILKEKRILI